MISKNDLLWSVARISEPYLGHGVHGDLIIEWLCFEESLDRWYLSENKNERHEFDLRVDADQEILNFGGDEFFITIPIADKPLSAAAIESAQFLADQLIWINQ
jgi:hypothetical protein